MRTDTHTLHDIDAINDCTLQKRLARGETLPSDVAHCVCSNKDRAAINEAMYSKSLDTKWTHTNSVPDDYLLVKADGMQRQLKSGKLADLSPPDRQFIYEHCGDNRVTTKRRGGKGHFVAPLLKLHKHQPLMLVSNTDVANGHANGTRVILDSVVFSPSATIETATVNGRSCKITTASSIDHLLCHSADDDNKIHKIKPQTMTCTVKAPLPPSFQAPSSATVRFTVRMNQFPAITNYATTGHKLQGQTKKNLVISVWSKRRNWNYVALSRVKTRGGLYLVNPLPRDVDFSIPQDLRHMMSTLRTKTPMHDCGFDIEEERARVQRRRLFPN